MARPRTITFALSGLIALAALLTAVAGSAAAGPNGIVLLTDPPSPSPSVTVDPSATPCFVLFSESVVPGIGFCVSPSPVVSASPFESFQGQTAVPTRSATPPPTGTAGGSSRGDSAPPILLLIALVFGAFGVAAVGANRRQLRR